MKSRRIFILQSALMLSVAILLADSASAGPAYRDNDGATPGGSSGTTAGGAWQQNGPDNNWTNDPTGSTATTTYETAGVSATPDAIFSAGTDVTGASALTITGAVSANSITIEEGSVSFTGASTPSLTLGPGGITIASTASAATTTFNDSVSSIVLNGAQNWDVRDGATLSVTGSAVISGAGPITVNNASTANGTVLIGPTSGTPSAVGNTFTGGVIVKGGTLSILANSTTSVSTAGSGTITLGDTTGSRSAVLTDSRNSAVTITNNIVVQAGSSGLALILRVAGRTNGITYNGNIVLNKNLTIAANSNTTTISGAAGNSISTNGNVLTLSGSGGSVSVSESITGAGSVAINNTVAGVVTLSGTNTYSGGTTITSGTTSALTTAAVGSSTGTGAVSVTATGVLRGTGAVGAATTGLVTVSGGGTLQGGTGTTGASQTLTALGGADFSGGGNILLTLGATNTHSQIDFAGGPVTFDTNQPFTFVNAQVGTYNNILVAVGGTDPGAANFTVTNPGGLTYTFSHDGANIDLNVIPEPTTGVLILSGLGVLMVARRRKGH